MSYETILFETDDAVAVVTINRPKVLNVLDSRVLRELADVFIRIGMDPDIKAAIITGAGEKAFVAGADVSEMTDFGAPEGSDFAARGQGVLNIIDNCPKPVIAAVNGYALGGGCELAMACDFIYASTKAVFGQPEIKLGIIPGFGGTQRLPRLVGKGRAKELIFTGENISAAEAHRIGLVNKIFEPDQLMAEAKKTAAQIAEKGAVALRLAKECVDQGLAVDLSNGQIIERNAFAVLCATQDKKEGMAAFMEKRKPKFQDR